ncbi:MAG: head GIN domain-containing protein [Ginsengibacter sp.]
MKKGNILLFMALLFISCNVNCSESGRGLFGNGNIKTETRNVADFTEIKNAGSIDVEIIAGNKFELKVEDDENLLPHIITEVKDGALHIYYDSDFSINESHGKVMVEVPTLNKITSSGSGDIKIDGTLKNTKEIIITSSGSGDLEGSVDAPSVQLSNSGSGDVELKGQSQNFVCKTRGSGDVKCRNLKSENVTVSVAGSSDVSVFASVSLKVNIAGSGDVTYSGNPTSPDISIAGSGTVNKAD